MMYLRSSELCGSVKNVNTINMFVGLSVHQTQKQAREESKSTRAPYADGSGVDDARRDRYRRIVGSPPATPPRAETELRAIQFFVALICTKF